MKYALIFCGVLFLLSCQKDKLDNPYDQLQEEQQEEETLSPDPTSMAGIHANIFKKTCANSGCHDGTFEPDFRTIESTYNTLVNHPVIKNDPQGTFTYRVVPGNVALSQLIARLEYDIDGNSGMMPLAIEPNSDWLEKRETYIQNIKDWIAKGAPDVFGN